MIFPVIFAISVCIVLLSVVVFLFCNKEKSKHQIILQNIRETINTQQNISFKQKHQLQDLQYFAELSENTMRKVVDNFHSFSASENEYLEQYVEYLGAFSENSLDLIKIYGRFVKVVS